MVVRSIQSEIEKYLFKGKTIIVYGARQVGKTTLVHEIAKSNSQNPLVLNADEPDIERLFEDINPVRLIPVFAGHDLIVIDEAQQIPSSGKKLKIIHDYFREIQFIATGSSAFDLAAKISEPMTGRVISFFLHPLSFKEMAGHHGFLTEKRMISHRMVFGYYPDIVLNSGLETKLLKNLSGSYLYKDLLKLDHIQRPALLGKILNALALQLGNEVSYREIAQLTQCDKGTVEKYIDLLEKSYIIFRLNGLSRNVRNEIKQGRKIYFCDNGIRNAIIGNFLPVEKRTDNGVLWENLMIVERMKYLMNLDIEYRPYFWRNTQQQEIDYVEEQEGQLTAFEIKWNPKTSARPPMSFMNGYPGTPFKVINPENFHEFVAD